jgi:hypothetical protein
MASGFSSPASDDDAAVDDAGVVEVTMMVAHTLSRMLAASSLLGC